MQEYVAELIPAHAGVILMLISLAEYAATYPRACGGDPRVLPQSCDWTALSPRMRG